MRVLGVDYGDKRIGLALSDPLKIIASPLETYYSKDLKSDINYIVDIVKKHSVSLIVLGLPKNMDGSEGERAEKTREFGQLLQKESSINIVYKDERLSSVSANRVLDEAEIHWSKRKSIVDTMSAQIILQSYLDIKK